MTLAVKAHAPTNTKGKRISVDGTGRKRRYYPWDYALNYSDNMRAAAKAFACEILAEKGYIMDEPVFQEEYVDIKTRLPVGFKWGY